MIRTLKALRCRLSQLARMVCGVERRYICNRFLADAERFRLHSGCNEDVGGMEASQARIVVEYHIIEKGLTMPNRHLAFGQEVVKKLMLHIEAFKRRYGTVTPQVRHAIGVIQEYLRIHDGYVFTDHDFTNRLKEFCSATLEEKAVGQSHVTHDEFYAATRADFFSFARSRHTVRHYDSSSVSMKRIEDAVTLAQTAPSACNRQHARVRCLTDRDRIATALAIQGGSRGFGHLADKVLVVTGDLNDCLGVHERNDAYINGGIFLMNLCYALHYYKIAHCILSCSIGERQVIKLREALNIEESEVLISMLTIGNAPDEFDVAASPRKPLNEIFTIA